MTDGRELAIAEETPRIRALSATLDSQALPRMVEMLGDESLARRAVRIALMAVHEKPELADCAPDTFVRAILRAAELGLTLGGQRGEAWPVPFYDKKRRQTVCQLIVGYRGLVRLLYANPRIASIETQLVMPSDHFRFTRGAGARVEHVIDPRAERRDEDAIGVWAEVGVLDDRGETHFVPEWMTRGQVEDVRRRSKQPDGDAWKHSWGQMARKTALHRVSNYLPLESDVRESMQRIAQDEADPDWPRQGGGYRARLRGGSEHQKEDEPCASNESTSTESRLIESERRSSESTREESSSTRTNSPGSSNPSKSTPQTKTANTPPQSTARTSSATPKRDDLLARWTALHQSRSEAHAEKAALEFLREAHGAERVTLLGQDGAYWRKELDSYLTHLEAERNDSAPATEAE